MSADKRRQSKAHKHEKGGATELITRLTRSRQNLDLTSGAKWATQTKFEQNIIALKTDSAGKTMIPDRSQHQSNSWANSSNCRLRAQVMFESDTDSSMVLDQQQHQRSSKGNKELHSETKYNASGRRTHSPLTELDEPKKESVPRSIQRRAEQRILAPNCMDYSLRVHRVRGSQIDGKMK